MVLCEVRKHLRAAKLHLSGALMQRDRCSIENSNQNLWYLFDVDATSRDSCHSGGPPCFEEIQRRQHHGPEALRCADSPDTAQAV